MIFFADENISKNIAYMLSHFERTHQVRALLDYFPQGTADTEWMSSIATWDGPVVALCADGRILRNKVEKRVLKESGFSFVCLSSSWTHLEWSVYGWKIIKAWPDIVANVEQARYPMVFEVKAGNLKVEPRGRIADL